MKINTHKVYNLVDPNGDKLLLRLGYISDERHVNVNAGWRWSFEGKKIPMPIRSRTWFCGFPEQIMLDWLKENGWCVHTCVDMPSGNAKVYDLPEPEEKEEVYFVVSDDDATNAYVRSSLEAASNLCANLNKTYGCLLYYVLKGTEV